METQELNLKPILSFLFEFGKNFERERQRVVTLVAKQ